MTHNLILGFVGIIAIYLVLAVSMKAIGMDIVSTVLILGVSFAIQLLIADKMMLKLMNAKTVTLSEHPKLHDMINNLCSRAGVPKPKIALMESSMPNAFALGIIQRKSTVVVTSALLGTLSEEELESVLAHEISHIKSRDVMIITMASFFSAIAWYVARVGGDDDDGLVAILVGLAVWFATFLIMRAISRYREFAADKNGAILTGNPDALCNALVKITGSIKPDSLSHKELKKIEVMGAFYFAPPLAKKVRTFLSTHPSTEDRIARLKALKMGDFHV